MEKLALLLFDIEDSYDDFVSAILFYSKKNKSRLNKVLNFIKTNKDVKFTDVVKFVSD